MDIPEGLIRQLYRVDQRAWTGYVFAQLHEHEVLTTTWLLDLMIDRLHSCGPKAGGRLIINVPPRHLKSICTSIAWPLFLCAHHPGCKVMIVTGSQALSLHLASERARLLQCRGVLTIFPALRSKPIPNGVRFANGSELIYSFVGQTRVGRGANVIILDDPLSPAQADDANRRQEVNAWYQSEIVPRLNNAGASVVLVMQRLQVDDLSGFLLRSGEDWSHMSVPAISDRHLSWIDRTTSIDGEDIVYELERHEVICPARQSAAQLRSLLFQMGARNFYAQYLQSPTDSPEHYTVNPELMAYDGWAPGMPFQSRGFSRVPLIRRVLAQYFGETHPAERSGLRRIKMDEWEAAAILQQRKLVTASARGR